MEDLLNSYWCGGLERLQMSSESSTVVFQTRRGPVRGKILKVDGNIATVIIPHSGNLLSGPLECLYRGDSLDSEMIGWEMKAHAAVEKHLGDDGHGPIRRTYAEIERDHNTALEIADLLNFSGVPSRIRANGVLYDVSPDFIIYLSNRASRIEIFRMVGEERQRTDITLADRDQAIASVRQLLSNRVTEIYEK